MVSGGYDDQSQEEDDGQFEGYYNVYVQNLRMRHEDCVIVGICS